MLYSIQYAPFKDTKKRTLVGRAKEIGLEECAINVLSLKPVSLDSLINTKVEGLETISKIETGIQHIIADLIGKDKENIAQMDHL